MYNYRADLPNVLIAFSNVEMNQNRTLFQLKTPYFSNLNFDPKNVREVILNS